MTLFDQVPRRPVGAHFVLDEHARNADSVDGLVEQNDIVTPFQQRQETAIIPRGWSS